MTSRFCSVTAEIVDVKVIKAAFDYGSNNTLFDRTDSRIIVFEELLSFMSSIPLRPEVGR